MRHLWALVLKLVIVTGAALVVLAPMAGATFGQALMVGVVNTALLYLLGDLVVLPAMGNAVAVVADAGVAFLATWLARWYAGLLTLTAGTALTLAAVIGVLEHFFHRYFLRPVLPGGEAGRRGGS